MYVYLQSAIQASKKTRQQQKEKQQTDTQKYAVTIEHSTNINKAVIKRCKLIN